MKQINFNIIYFFHKCCLRVLLIYIICALPYFAAAQWARLLSPSTKGNLVIPFEYVNNFIIINVQFERLLPLKFIFDTGAEHTIITKREITDGLGIHYEKEFKVKGADGMKEVSAYLIRDVQLGIEQRAFEHESMLVFKEDYFRIDDYVGMQIHGILGGSIFSKYIVQIDYKARQITFHQPNDTKIPLKKFTPLPIDVHKHKPYLNASLRLANDSILPIKLLVDSGAGLALLLQSYTHPQLAVPPNAVPGNLGFGLGGNMAGFISRTKQLNIQSKFTFNQLFTRYQQLPDSIEFDMSILHGRNGILGNQILDQFQLYIDYNRQLLYLKPNSTYGKDSYKYDRSGLSVIATGMKFNQYIVQQVIINSPAALAGIQIGDVITKINGWSTTLFSLEGVVTKLQKPPNTLIRLTLRRPNGALYSTSFRLKDLV
jgi:PDZ domain/Aspartyl protease